MRKKKAIDFEINLLPVISILAVCISFLLLTAVWIQIGTLEVKQALGDSSVLAQKESPSIWVIMDASGDVILQIKNVQQVRQKQVRFVGQSSSIPWGQISDYAESLKSEVPELNMALVFPDRLTSFDDVIKAIDLLKKSNISDVGIAPL